MSSPRDSDDGVIFASPALLIAAQREARVLKQPPGKVLSRLAGAFRSPFKGRGMEFDESRPYQPGDDIRNMDWRVTARTSKPHSKVFREERERPVLLWGDFRSSMFFGSQGCFKSVLAARLCALLAWQANQQGDRLGVLLFSDSRHLEHRPKGGKPATLHVIKQLAQFTQGASSPITVDGNAAEHALGRLAKVARPGSLVYLVSDFRFSYAALETTLNRIGRHNEAVLVHVSDPLERDLPAAGVYRVSDGVNEREINSADARLRQGYSGRFDRHQQRLRELCRKTRARYLAVSTETPALEALIRGLGINGAGQ